jgi:SAM-dependent methyltransferase
VAKDNGLHTGAVYQRVTTPQDPHPAAPRPALPDWLRSSLACPACHAELAEGLSEGRCPNCGRLFPLIANGLPDLRILDWSTADWQRRQGWMAREYDSLLDDGDHAARGFHNDYGAIAGLLARCAGRVLDVGGGVGVTRHWLPATAEYVLLEPSDGWADPRWQNHADPFPCLREPPPLVRAFAEALPFSSETFDVVLHLWTLNHVVDVTASVREGLRVLRRGGLLIAVLEEASPSWSALLRGRAPVMSMRQRLRWAARRLVSTFRTRPLQPDHIAVEERLLTRAPGARLRFRGWVGSYLTIELEST